MAKDPVEIGYFLPKTRVSAAVEQKLTQCPASDGTKPGFEYKVALASKAVPDRLVLVDARSGFLADRSTSLKFTDDGLIKEFNGSRTGQGGPMLVSLIKAGAVAASMAAGPAATAAAAASASSLQLYARIPGRAPAAVMPRMVTRYELQCTAEARAKLAEVSRLKTDIGRLEDRILKGEEGVAVQQLLAQRRKEFGEAEAKLTQTTKLKEALSPVLQKDGPSGLTGFIPAPDFGNWFKVVAVLTPPAGSGGEDETRPTLDQALARVHGDVVPGQYGYLVTVKPDSRMTEFLSCGPKAGWTACGGGDVGEAKIATRDLVYRQPVPASVSLRPLHVKCEAAPCPDSPTNWKDAEQASAADSVKLPQLSRLFVLPTGGGGIFGSRTVAAEFGAGGEPTMLKYEVGSSSKNIASAIDAGASAAQTVDGAELAATKRRIEEMEAEEKLRKLLEPDLDAPE